jgi:mono/diheme cytochrome c family protein
MRGAGAVAGLVAALIAIGASVAAGDTIVGHALYRRNCGFCHGRAGIGDGPAAAALKAAPRNLRDGVVQTYSVDDLTQRILDGQPLELALDPPALRKRGDETEALVVHLRRLPLLDWDAISYGWDLYAEHCADCHGDFGVPPANAPRRARKPRNLADESFQKSIRDQDLLRAVRHGKRGMPRLVPSLSDSDAASLLAFVRLLSPGLELYTTYCANCHGDEGRGAEADAAAFEAPSLVFDREFLAKHDSDTLRIAIWHMLKAHKPVMPHYRWVITESQARAIVLYLKRTTD